MRDHGSHHIHSKQSRFWLFLVVVFGHRCFGHFRLLLFLIGFGNFHFRLFLVIFSWRFWMLSVVFGFFWSFSAVFGWFWSFLVVLGILTDPKYTVQFLFFVLLHHDALALDVQDYLGDYLLMQVSKLMVEFVDLLFIFLLIAKVTKTRSRGWIRINDLVIRLFFNFFFFNYPYLLTLI